MRPGFELSAGATGSPAPKQEAIKAHQLVRPETAAGGGGGGHVCVSVWRWRAVTLACRIQSFSSCLDEQNGESSKGGGA